jgi:hypothetical protein
MSDTRYVVEEQADGLYSVIDTYGGYVMDSNIVDRAEADKKAGKLNWDNIPGKSGPRRGQPPPG